MRLLSDMCLKIILLCKLVALYRSYFLAIGLLLKERMDAQMPACLPDCHAIILLVNIDNSSLRFEPAGASELECIIVQTHITLSFSFECSASEYGASARIALSSNVVAIKKTKLYKSDKQRLIVFHGIYGLEMNWGCTSQIVTVCQCVCLLIC